jgi:hypothetical protein
MAQALGQRLSWLMKLKLFRTRPSPPNGAKTADPPPAPPPTSLTPAAEPKPQRIPLTAEQKDLLQTPVDPRVERILQEIYADRAAAERALKSRRIIEFPLGDSGERRVVEDENGFWRIVPVPTHTKSAQLSDRL